MKKRLLMIGLFAMNIACLSAQTGDKVSLTVDDANTCTLTNGLLTMTIDAKGNVTSLVTKDNCSVIRANKSSEKGYHNFVCDSHSASKSNKIAFAVVRQTDDLVELQYTNTSLPLNYTIGYIMRSGVSGVYNYMTVKCVDESDNELHESRLGWRVNNSQMTYAYVSDTRQDTVPYVSQLNRQSDSNPYGYVSSPQDATFELSDGRVYTKYDWANYTNEDLMHGMMGWTNSKYKNSYKFGAWVISPSYEWVASGVQKQELMVHQTDESPIILAHFESNHFGSATTRFAKGQEKIYGPYLFYVNTGSSKNALIADAKKRVAEERAAWPYEWFDNPLYPKAAERGTVRGKVSLDKDFHTSSVRVVLAKPGVKPYLQGNDYMFWTTTDADGNFSIPNVRPGNYALYAWALNGEATGTLETKARTVNVGTNDWGTIDWTPQKYATTVWMIGESNRRSSGFKWSDMPRTYGQWRKTPSSLVYEIGKSKPSDDWYFAQGVAGTWQIKFNLDHTPSKPMHLTIATAGAAGGAKLTVKCNGKQMLGFKTENDASVYRSAMQSGRDSLFTCVIPADSLKVGANTIDLSAWNYGANGLSGILYDCIKLEAEENISTGVSAKQSKKKLN